MGKTQIELGRKFGRPDIERCDLFIDDGFLDWDTYTGRPEVLFESSKKGAQMYSSVPSGGHKKSALQANSGYFDSEFKTIFVGDPYLEKWRISGRPPAHPRKGPWIPSGPAKHHSTPGDHYGTFTKASEAKAFSPLVRPAKAKERGLINFLTNPGKKGNSGYLNICINKYPPHTVKGKTDTYTAPAMLYSKTWKEHKKKILNGPLKSTFFPQPFFDINPYKDPKIGPTYVKPREKVYGRNPGIFYPPATPKAMGNNHDGCFDKFPEWKADPFRTPNEAQKLLNKPTGSDLIFQPQPALKTYYTTSIVNRKIEIACNENTWRTMKPITYPQFNL